MVCLTTDFWKHKCEIAFKQQKKIEMREQGIQYLQYQNMTSTGQCSPIDKT